MLKMPYQRALSLEACALEQNCGFGHVMQMVIDICEEMMASKRTVRKYRIGRHHVYSIRCRKPSERYPSTTWDMFLESNTPGTVLTTRSLSLPSTPDI